MCISDLGCKIFVVAAKTHGIKEFIPIREERLRCKYSYRNAFVRVTTQSVYADTTASAAF